jgi:3-hydroxyisobutyrate dehydrogenase-like beta-hydroxyacid dehydrogenase
MTERQVGIVGVGLMGLGIATNVQRAGWPLHFLDHPGNQPTGALREAGATSHGSAKSLAEAVDIVIVCVTGAPEVEDVLTRPDGILAGLRPGAAVVDCSTSLPGTTAALAAKVQGGGGRFMDAPMTRTPKEAMEGRLNLIVGGDPEDFERLLPLFRTFAENVTHVGPAGSGHAMKLLHNFVSLGFSAVLAEAAAAAEGAGIDSRILHRVLDEGGGRGVVLDRFAPSLLGGAGGAFRFTLANAAKDTGYFLRMTSEDGEAGAVACAVAGVYARSVEEGRGGDYVPALSALARSWMK